MLPNVITTLDLEPIMVKAMDYDEGMGWSLDITNTVAEEYRKYLTLCIEHPNKSIVPPKMVDSFWHLHILDTQKYAQDCQIIFGYFLHHFPYFGMRGEEDASNLRSAWDETCSIYRKRFGDLSDLWVNSARCPNCGRRKHGDNSHTMNVRPTLSMI